jgi:hypothetical protein
MPPGNLFRRTAMGIVLVEDDGLIGGGVESDAAREYGEKNIDSSLSDLMSHMPLQSTASIRQP